MVALGLIGLGLTWTLMIDWWWVAVEAVGDNATWTLQVSLHILWFTRHRCWKLPSAARSSNPSVMFNPKRVRQGVLAFRWYRRLARGMNRRMVVQSFDGSLQVGLGSPDQTALVVGWVNLMMGWWLQERIAPKAEIPPQWRIDPDWDRIGIRCRLASRVKIKGWMIAAAIAETCPLGLHAVTVRARRQISWQKFRQTFITPGNIQSRD